MNTTIITHTLFLGSVYSIMLTNSWSILCGSTLHIFLQLQDPKDLIKKPSKACKRCQISIVHITTKRSIFGILWIWFARSKITKILVGLSPFLTLSNPFFPYLLDDFHPFILITLGKWLIYRSIAIFRKSAFLYAIIANIKLQFTLISWVRSAVAI